VAEDLEDLVTGDNFIIEKIKIKIKRVRQASTLPIPKFQTSGASGCDLMADISEPVILKPGERRLIPTGFALSIPEGFEGQIRPRSGLALKKGISITNAPGTIDADYRGEVKIILMNLGQETVTIQPGDRIAQLVIQRVYQVEWLESESLDNTARAAGGFGHTGTSAQA